MLKTSGKITPVGRVFADVLMVQSRAGRIVAVAGVAFAYRRLAEDKTLAEYFLTWWDNMPTQPGR